MPIVEKHAPGDFCWMELATTDHAAAKKFYSELFPWSFTEFPIGPDELYTMFKVDGRDVGAAYTLRAEQQKQGIPAHWNLYVAVENAEAAVSRALELGAKLLASPLDVFDAGRMDVLEDPTGAAFSVWQAKRHTGFGIKGVPATFCVADLSTPEQEAASRFYGQLFGWRIREGRRTTGPQLLPSPQPRRIHCRYSPARVSRSGGASLLANLFAGVRLPCHRRQSQKSWRATLHAADGD